ncbi:hypothetical protein [Streptomyces sp. R44]|uniref:Uncharacterized protein n=1 Tax=Streptomyces sp. R44 TaxID=3238633 RepID=A0AB39TD31_9ACTN
MVQHRQQVYLGEPADRRRGAESTVDISGPVVASATASTILARIPRTPVARN